MHWKPIALIAAGLTLAACSSTPPSTPPTAAPMLRPSACMASCPELPRLDSDREAGAIAWLHEVVFLAGECRRMHDECRSARR